MKFRVIGVALAAGMVLLSCTDLWGPLDNPADPSAESYQGYETVKNADDVAPVTTDSGEVDFVPALVANKVVDATGYEFEIAGTNGFSEADILHASGRTDSNVYLPVEFDSTEAEVTYYWRVRAQIDGTFGNWSSGAGSFSLRAIAGLSPESTGTTSDTTPFLDWDDVTDAVSYEIAVAETEAGLESAAVVTSTVSEYQTTETLSIDDVRWWRVRAVNTGGLRGGWTQGASFTIVPPPPPPLLTPANGSSTTDRTPTFSWETVADASSYEIALAGDATSLGTATPQEITTTSHTPGADLAYGDWYWHVRSLDSYGNAGEWSETRSVTVSFIAMVSISSGTFNNGTSSVTVSAFRMSSYEITQSQYEEVIGSNPSNFNSNTDAATSPVERASWYDALVFCNRLSISEGLTPVYTISGSTNPDDWGAVPTSSDATWNAAVMNTSSTGYRLPTEAEWEYAARAGTTTTYYWGDSTADSTIEQYAWYTYNSGSRTHGVGQKLPNDFGLYDMSGNVWEWCWDWYGTYPSGDQTDPTGASSGTARVIRGGSWSSSSHSLRSANRGSSTPYSRYGTIGFRVVASQSGE